MNFRLKIQIKKLKLELFQEPPAPVDGLPELTGILRQTIEL